MYNTRLVDQADTIQPPANISTQTLTKNQMTPPPVPAQNFAPKVVKMLPQRTPGAGTKQDLIQNNNDFPVNNHNGFPIKYPKQPPNDSNLN